MVGVSIGPVRLIGIGWLKGGAAAAAPDGIGVLDTKTGAAQLVGIVKRRAGQIPGARLVNENADALPLDNGVPVLALIQGHAVLESGTSSMLDKNAQPLPGSRGRLGQKGLKLFDGAIRNGDHLLFTLSEGMIEVKRRRTTPQATGLPPQRFDGGIQ